MPHKKQKSTVLACFSPPVMIATFLIEIVLAIYVVARYRLSPARRLIVTTLVMLAAFQLCEYFVCGGLGVSSSGWSRAGFVAISTLPPLGVHLISTLAGKQHTSRARQAIGLSYALMTIWITVFILSEGVFRGHECSGNYVIFSLSSSASWLYSLYYYGMLLGGIWLAMSYAKQSKHIPTQKALRAMVVGYLVFLVPTAVVNTINPETMAGIPSIMCGFAVLFAFILALYIAPKTKR